MEGENETVSSLLSDLYTRIGSRFWRAFAFGLHQMETLNFLKNSLVESGSIRSAPQIFRRLLDKDGPVPWVGKGDRPEPGLKNASLKWCIKNPAPLDYRLRMWGDFHFGKSLEKWLMRMGHRVVSDFHGEWQRHGEGDVLLVLRGKHRFTDVGKGRFGVRALWIMSHPESVSISECESYDLVFVGSRIHARELAARLDKPVYVLMQGTDTERFRPDGLPGPRKDFVFVGNTRGVRRDCVELAIQAGLPVKIWGRGWTSGTGSGRRVARYVPNEQLPGIYAGAKVTLNDHWPDMRRQGYINNRIYDALACGCPVLSDHFGEIDDLLDNTVLTYRDESEFRRCVERLAHDYPAVLKQTARGGDLVRSKHTFEMRVQELDATVTSFLEK